MSAAENLQKRRKKNMATITLMAIAVVFLCLVCIFAGPSGMSFSECMQALMKNGETNAIRIIWNIRIPRMLAALIVGAGLSLSGLIMQTTLNNAMAAPSTLGVSNAAVFGANLSIIAFAGGFLDTGHNVANYALGANPFATSLMAFVFATISVFAILGLCKIRAYSPNVVVLAGIAMGAVWTAATTILQFFATDVGISAAVIWNFGDLGRATYRADIIMLAVVLAGAIFFMFMSWKFNTLLSGEATAKSMGTNVDRLRFISLLFASLITAVCVSFLGVIGFVGIICPHIIKKIFGQDHRVSIPMSALCGSMLLLFADTLSRYIGNGAALPVGAITSLLGAPFFIAIILGGRDHHA